MIVHLWMGHINIWTGKDTRVRTRAVQAGRGRQERLSMATISCGLLLGLLMLPGIAPGYVQRLSYAEGGSRTEDPGAHLAPLLKRYLDGKNGNDRNDGRSLFLVLGTRRNGFSFKPF